MESPDGKFLYYGKDLNCVSLWRTPVTGQEEEHVLDIRSGWSIYTLVGNEIYYIAGTFNQAAFGLGPNPRAADLIISFREFPDLDNGALTGPQNPAYAIGPKGPEVQVNKSNALVDPMPGVMYADADSFTTGMGMHGAVGARELHNFCAAVGPDFRSGMVDDAPSGNADVAPTMGEILGLTPVAGVTGRVLREALAPAAGWHRAHQEDSRPRAQSITATASRSLKDSRVTTTLELTRYAGHDYLDGADTVTTPAK